MVTAAVVRALQPSRLISEDLGTLLVTAAVGSRIMAANAPTVHIADFAVVPTVILTGQSGGSSWRDGSGPPTGRRGVRRPNIAGTGLA